MESVNNHHDYEPVSRSKNEIRVLQLLPGKRSDPIRGTLLLTSTDRGVSYDALSYMWGNPQAKINIVIDANEHFLVTKNAESALRDLRVEDEALTLWIDAICINQQNIEERSHQVKLMRQIYQNASTVHIWLGVSLHADHPACQRLTDLNEESTMEDLGDDALFWNPLLAIGKDEYWTRVWIQQEVAFAQRVIVHCRTYTIPGDHLLRLQHLIHEKNMASRADLNSRWDSLNLHYVDLSGPHRDRPGENRKSTRRYTNIVEALSLCEHLSATDPRDRVYAILSLVDGDLVSEFDVDYRNTVIEVYSKVASFVLRKYNSLGFLLRAFQSNRKHALPSWVPDWSCTSTSAPPVIASQLIVRCTDGQGPRYSPQISEDGLSLTVFGKQLETLAAINTRMVWQKDLSGLSYIQILVNQLKQSGLVRPEDQQDVLDAISFDDISEAKWKAFLRTMMRAELPQERADAEDYFEVFKIMLPAAHEIAQTDGMSLAEAMPENIRGLWLVLTQLMGMATLGNYFAITKTGKSGLVPEGGRPGDEIWAMLHCPKPILLRRVGGHYEVVGPCYVDDGYLFEDLQGGLGDEQRYPIQEIILR